jgi:SNF2 family DNA or RNA helicase
MRAPKVPITLKPFQETGVEFLQTRNRCILADDCGLGKTIEGLFGRHHDAVNVVCPASVKIQWEEAVSDFTLLKPFVCNGRGSFDWAKPGYVMISNPEIMPDWINRPDNPLTILLDEAHTYRNNRSTKYRNAKYCLDLVCNDTQIVAMTGTPLVNKLTDIANLLDILGLLDSHFGGRDNLASMMGGRAGKRGDLRNCEVTRRVTDLLGDVMMRRVKEDVLPDLPSKKYEVLRISEWSNQLQVAMDRGLESLEAYETMSGPVPAGSLPPITELARARKMMAIEKTPYAVPLVEQRLKLGQVVLFSAHRSPVEHFGDRSDWGMITGSVTVKRRQAAAQAFRDGDMNGIALTIGAGNCGLNLQSANQTIFMDCSYQLAENLQAEDRTCRIGQLANEVSYTWIVYDHPLERRMGQILTGKKTLFDQICNPVTVKE